MGRQAQAHGQRGQRVQPSAALTGHRVVRHVIQRIACQRVCGVAVAPKPARPVGLHPHSAEAIIGADDEVHRMHGGFTGQPRLARKVQGLFVGLPVGPHEQFGKGRVGFVGPGLGQRDLEHRHQIDVHQL